MKEVKRALETYKKTRTEMLMDAGRRSAINVEREAKQNVRVDTGRLRSSIRHRVSDDPLVFDVFTEVFYAPYEEFGTGRHLDIPKEQESYALQFKGKRSVEGRPGQAFMFPAWEQDRPRYIRNVKRLL